MNHGREEERACAHLAQAGDTRAQRTAPGVTAQHRTAPHHRHPASRSARGPLHHGARITELGADALMLLHFFASSLRCSCSARSARSARSTPSAPSTPGAPHRTRCAFPCHCPCCCSCLAHTPASGTSSNFACVCCTTVSVSARRTCCLLRCCLAALLPAAVADGRTRASRPAQAGSGRLSGPGLRPCRRARRRS